jgi:hypothetical protein
MAGEPLGHGAHEPGLTRDQPHVAVQVATAAPGRVPVLPGHVADDEGRHGGHAGLVVGVQEVGVALDEGLVDRVGLWHEVRPVEERPRHVQPVLVQDRKLLAHHRRVVGAPHQRSTRAGPEVRAQPQQRSTVPLQLAERSRETGAHLTAPEVSPATR